MYIQPNVIDAIIKINPAAQASVSGNDINSITWENGTVEIPKADIQTKLNELQAEYDSQEYARDRQARYNSELPMGDQFDAILKGFNQLRLSGQDLPADLDGVIGIWLGIKSAIPKE